MTAGRFKEGTSTIVSADIKSISSSYDYFRVLVIRKSNPFWAKPVFFTNGQSRCTGKSQCADERNKEGQSLLRDAQGHAPEVQGNICKHIQQLLLEMEGKYVHIMALTSRNAVCEMVYDVTEDGIR